MTMTTTGPIDLDRLSLDAVRAGAFRDRPVTVLGLARSGLALARFLADSGAHVTIYDGRAAAELAEAIAALDGRPVTLALGAEVDPAATWAEADLFLRLSPAPTIGVTGTKGKTTTASLTAALLATDPAHPVVLGGNIG
ncbi:MAG: UDP-N-acetylmuramoylalanine--D-glutamate ligase, partial [Chloroflexota bacterium]|nr:UDP-N-acetylmuramoylalanine--D-glutamate ligase [Chloroflexota bacterium]